MLEDIGAATSGKGLHPNAKDADDVDQVQSDSEESDSDEDDMEALQAELAKIRCAACPGNLQPAPLTRYLLRHCLEHSRVQASRWQFVYT